jgi:hypothetical protein
VRCPSGRRSHDYGLASTRRPAGRTLPEDEAFYVVAVAGMPTRVAQAGTLNEVLETTALK